MEGARVSMGPVERVRGFLLSPRLLGWTKLLTRFLSLEALVQALGFACGIILVRVLPKTEYGLFTIANTMQQTMNLLADNGISSGLSSIGGRVWNDKFRFGQLLHTAMRLRRILAFATIVVVSPILIWMLVGNGSSLSYAALLTGIVLMGLYFQLSVGVLIVAPRMHLEVLRIQMLGIWSAGLRLALIVTAYTIFLNAAVALLAAGISFAFQEILLRRWVPTLARLNAPVNAEDRREILSIVRAQAPNSIFYCLQSQLTVWLITIFGSTAAVAEVGALGRLTVIFLMIHSVMGNVVYPRFARTQEPHLLWRRYWQVVGGFSAVSAILMAVTWAFPDLLLWVLGPKYTHLKEELILMMLSAVSLSVLGAMWHLNVSRGWIVSAWALIPASVLTQAALIVVLDLSQVRDVLLLNIFSNIPGYFLNFWRTRRGVREAQEAALAAEQVKPLIAG